MRAIKFRGKSTNGQWYYGYLTIDAYGKLFIDTLEGNQVYSNAVIPETVGQFTDITDNAHNDIYEDDIIGNVFDGNKSNCVVKYIQGILCAENAAGSVRPLNISSKTHCNWLSVTNGSKVYDFTLKGNIHDNPELLK